MSDLARPKLALRHSAIRPILAALEPRDRREHAAEILLYRWRGIMLSLQLQAYARTKRGERCRAADAPVFIVGYWRSGTTWLHELLAVDPIYVTPTTEQCMNPATLLTPGLLKAESRSVVRPMDGVTISSHTPQEDEFALLALGAPSVYRALLAPSLLRDGSSLVAGTRDGWQAALDIVLDQIRQDGRTILLKSPTHGLRLDALARVFPNAKFIAIAREPEELLSSNERMWRELLPLYSLGRWSAEWPRQFFATSFRIWLDQMRQAATMLPAERFAIVTFDELIADPRATLDRVCRQMSLPRSAGYWERLETLLSARSTHRVMGRGVNSADNGFLASALGPELVDEARRLAGRLTA